MPQSSGTEWGEFVYKTDPWRAITDAFTNQYKETVGNQLANERAKTEQRLKDREQKAIEDYRNLQVMIQAAQDRENKRQWEEEQKATESRFTRGQELAREQLAGKAPTPLEQEAQQADIGYKKAVTAKAWREAEKPVTAKTPSELRQLENDITGLQTKADAFAPHKFKIDKVAFAPSLEKLDEYDKLYRGTIPPEELWIFNQIVQKRKDFLEGGGKAFKEPPNKPSGEGVGGAGAFGGGGETGSTVDDWLDKLETGQQ